MATCIATFLTACLLCAIEFYFFKLCIDAFRRPGCLNYCMPPPHVMAGDTLHLELNERMLVGDHRFYQRCFNDFPELWQT